MTTSVIRSDPRCPMHLLTKEFMQNPYPVLREMHRDAPAMPVEANGYRMWIVTRYPDVRRVLTGRGFLKDMLPRRKDLSAQSVLMPGRTARLLHGSRRSVLERDGADHRRMRAVLNPWFDAGTVNARAPRIAEIARSLAENLPAGEPIDLVARFARPLAAKVIGDLVGLADEDLHEFPFWANDMVTGRSIENIESAGVALFRFAQRMVRHKRRNPADDLYSALVRLHDEQGVFDDNELASTFMVLIVGGCEPMNAVINSLFQLLRHPHQLAMVRADQSLTRAAVEEGIRLESPFRMLPPRYSDNPFVLDDVVVPARDFIVPSLATANRDPDVFSHPEVFDVARDTRGHLSFGYGPHRCLGSELGKLESRIALDTLLERFPKIRLAVRPQEITWRPGLFMRRVDTFPVILG